MKNLCLGMNHRSLIRNTDDTFLTTELKETPFLNYDSVIVSTPAVKEPGKCLLIKLLKATPWLAEQGKRYKTSRNLTCVFYHFLLVKKEFAGQLPFFV